ncbi:hypothetical protein [Streptomyces spectabilis]|uniref:LPXTG cell wall anchor domain-containing protein n=1 Tax=Streptomyces spectabilis TaxID=68270 RepID=A0A516RAI2_STRST|nr:hypothetical protein [Streptomyces spectabilis]QDQ12672.1 hypothetical protein FH965_20645 [Streptomyces spectabilis]
MRATRRTIRTAAIATGAIAALAVPTTAAFADTPPAPHSADGATAPGDRSDGDRTPDRDPTPTPDDHTAPDDHTKPDDRTKPDEDKDQDRDRPVPGGWESKGTVSLGGGWTAQVDVNASARSAKAQLLQDGVLKGSLSAQGQSASTRISGYTFTLSADGNVTRTGSGDDKDTDKPVPGGWVAKGTVSLGHGWSAKVDVNASARSAKAQLLKNGVAKGSLKAYIKPASTKIDGCTFTLRADGTVTRTGTPAPPKPKPQPSKKRTFVREYQNLGRTGFDAKVYRTRSGYEADMIAPAPDTGKKIVWDTLKQTGAKAAYGQHNGAHFVLHPDGTMKGWVEGGAKPQPKPTRHTSTKVPQGGVKAGAEGVDDTANASHDTPLVAAGGGMAALGAAGLGFAMYRRKQNG